MRFAISLAVLFALFPAIAEGQNARQAGRRGAQAPSRTDANQGTNDRRVTAAVKRLLEMDGNGDGVLTKDEVADTRLYDMMNEADRNQDGQVTTTELNNYFSVQLGLRPSADSEPRAETGRPPGAGPGAGSPMGPGGPRGPAGMPRPGMILPDFMVDRLQLSEDQAIDLKRLQDEVDRRLKEILTEEQWQQLSTPPAGGPEGGFRRGGQPGGLGPGAGRQRGQ